MQSCRDQESIVLKPTHGKAMLQKAPDIHHGRHKLQIWLEIS